MFRVQFRIVPLPVLVGLGSLRGNGSGRMKAASGNFGYLGRIDPILPPDFSGRLLQTLRAMTPGCKIKVDSLGLTSASNELVTARFGAYLSSVP